MKIRISKKTKRIIVLYLAILVILYVVVFVIPEVTDKFETTQVLENGNIEVSSEATGYVVKDEAVCTADTTGDISYKLDEGIVVKKGTVITDIEEAAKEKRKKADIGNKYRDYLDRLRKYDLLSEGNKAPISGIYSASIDGHEKYFRIENLENIKKEKTESLNISQLDLKRESVVKGEPIFKISSDDKWYIVCWMEKADVKQYEAGQKVRITLPASTVDARVQSIEKEGEYYKVVFYLNVYYKDFASTRTMDMTIVLSNTSGLIVDNECIISKDGVQGVYVKTKDDDTYFVPIKVKTSNDKQSIIYESVFVNDDYEQVETVSVYQEVLRDPQSALEKDMKEDSKEAQ